MYTGKINTKAILRLFLKLMVGFLFATLIAFISIDTLPGDAATILAGITGDSSSLRTTMGLDSPLYERYINWIIYFTQGDLGTSIIFDLPVYDVMVDRFWITFPLAIFSFIISIVFGVMFGTISVIKNSIQFDSFIMIFISLPVVWLSIAFISIFSLYFGILPSGGAEFWTSYILPSFALGLGQGAITARYTKTALGEIVNKDFIHFAQVRGMTKGQALFKHGLPAVGGSLLAILGLQIGFLLTGVVVVERLFSMPGIGDLLYQAILMRDVTLASGIIGFLAILIVILNTIIDVLAYTITPVLRRGYNA